MVCSTVMESYLWKTGQALFAGGITILGVDLILAILDHSYFLVLLVFAFVLAIVGITLMFIEVRRDKAQKKLEAEQRAEEVKRVYNYLYDKTKIYEGQLMAYPHVWVSTTDIANGVGLKPERVREICFVHKEIDIQAKKHIPDDKEPEDKWAIKRFVDVFEQ